MSDRWTLKGRRVQWGPGRTTLEVMDDGDGPRLEVGQSVEVCPVPDVEEFRQQIIRDVCDTLKEADEYETARFIARVFHAVDTDGAEGVLPRKERDKSPSVSREGEGVG